jgi:dinuclear metal center YbgI/SA1388 family protein
MLTVADICGFLEQLAPLDLAADWDNVGLLLGAESSPVRKVMTCLTVTPESAAEAIAAGAQLIVTHHPILFRGIKRLTAQAADGKMLLDLANADIAVYSPHSAFDNTPAGINDLLAERLQLTNVRPLRRQTGHKQCKVVVFVPEKDLNKVSDAMFAAGAGRIGEYRECSFRLAGTGTFHGSEASKPTIGEKGRREEVGEWRLEAVCSEGDVDRVVAALRAAHSYEEPAYDIYALRPERGRGGAGRIGTLAAPLPLKEFGLLVKHRLAANCVQTVGTQERQVETVALACGAAAEFLPDAVRHGADVFLTGEARFHDCLAASAQAICLVLPGHYATERCGIEHLADVLKRHFSELDVWPSREERDPLSAV